ncbi:DUF1499 domain-containing protein [Crocosphaera sp. UHCC 0190]|uniref:DUF1499 domain-containing protein n=1 Tax=Crocosphaera sp. UHCC 0190 TaxID=3110246 RepID=UPI002B20563B|nr:DUF1499 domain-containing protein [Crocosphaera sp. UHCC 0190]MEA5509745.1 DUF1499 domain-containing protein [Crocosphaera sp. UHCC 0190]
MSVTKDTSKSMNRGLLTTIILLGIVIIWIGARLIFPDVPTIFAGTIPDNLGSNNGQLASCPNTPNCVSSQSKDAEHSIKPLSYQGDNSDAIAKLKTIINQQERSQIISETDDYLYAQFTSPWMGFVDDVEFYVNSQQGRIEVRSASRLGESDLGVNRQRIEQIRQAFKTTVGA